MKDAQSTWQLNSLDQDLLRLALTEDLGHPWCDATTQLLFADCTSQLAPLQKAEIISKHKTPIVVCGIPIICSLLTQLDPKATIQIFCQDGEVLMPGAVLVEMHANPQALLMAERTLLNFLRHLCAVATLTTQFVEKVQQTRLKILDTRKTTPGFRHLEKYAVHCGGGVNHRMGLYDALMVKDTHVDLLGGMEQAIHKLPLLTAHDKDVIVEVRNFEELEIVLVKGREKVTRVLLDNMNIDLLNNCVRACKSIFPTEVSGNINLTTIEAIAKSGADFASVGMLTHSAGNVDLSMRTMHRGMM
jgi:nicotinate-nucleotide pyrophosphorylase (carboxylating)